MILKSERIAELLEQGKRRDAEDPLVITPSLPADTLRTSGAASIDLRLGTWFVTLRHARMEALRVDDEQSGARLTKTHYVRFGDDYILHPRMFVLGVTLEWLRIPKDLAAYVIGRSSWGRRGLIIATATGVHPGFTGCITLELTNVGEIPIAVRPGMNICQLFVHRVETSGTSSVDLSQFNCLRKPRVGQIGLDEMATKLSRAK